MARERLQKLIAGLGLASRREAEEWIRDGLITVNGKVARLGDQADLEQDHVKVKNKLLTPNASAPKMFAAFHKPVNCLSILKEDPDGRPTLEPFFRGKTKGRLILIGKLDFTSEGLMLITTDGKIANQIQKDEDLTVVYEAKVKGEVSDLQFNRIQKGTIIDGQRIRPEKVWLSGNTEKKSKIRLLFKGLHAYDVHTLLERNGILVDRLQRIQIGGFQLKGIAKGALQPYPGEQFRALATSNTP